MPSLFSAKDITKSYKVSNNPLKKGHLPVLQGVNFSLNAGQTLAVVGESGSGKSTLARVLVGADSPDSGELLFEGRNILKKKNKFEWFKNIRMIFQDASASLNPRTTIRQSLEEPLRNGTSYTANQRRERIMEVLEMVGLRAEYAQRYPHTFSGGQRQRIAIARALLLRPKVIVADEPVSALDVSVQAQIINLLLDLQDQLDLAYVFISHDLGLVQHFSNKVLVLNDGKQEEYGRVTDIFSQPKSQYTLELLNASAGYKKPE